MAVDHGVSAYNEDIRIFAYQISQRGTPAAVVRPISEVGMLQWSGVAGRYISARGRLFRRGSQQALLGYSGTVGNGSGYCSPEVKYGVVGD